MVQVPRRGVSGPTLIRLLARLTDADVSESRQSLSDRLSLWLGWTDAIALSTVLEGKPLAVTPNTQALDSALERDYERMRAALGHAIADEKAFVADVFVPTRPGVKPPSPAEAMTDFTIYRQRYQTLQQAMETHIAKLRVNLRAALTAQTPARARLAMVDAIVERSLSIQERRLLAAIPGMLEKHFKRLRQSAEMAAKEAAQRADAPAQSAVTPDAPQQAQALNPSPGEPGASDASTLSSSAAKTESGTGTPTAQTMPEAAAPSPATKAALPKRAVPLINSRLAPRANQPVTPPVPGWLATFRKDMRSVLLAELDIRLQPIEGLLAALRDR
ncbi:DUF3348 domain-containing protein [Bordetella sp. 15P40C-2]|uniref:DUF3348 domain-containing protein n=1 Tax=Bordetella sp. 15P40C-2 TaxID=2572246 RepID=UPI00132966C1|nr:DUF3348 domain-containing protein [Bordetella sp. 15P40C-2]MVW70916.1 DUF3348 family protein [Bordetella sp. 15P40C-2]